MPEAGQLTEEQKIAVLLASLDESIAASILQQLEPAVMARVAETIRGLGIISGADRSKAITDCFRGIVAMGNAVQGDDQIVNSLLSRAIGEKRASALLQEREPVSRNAFAGLADIPSEQIGALLANEQAAVVAIILQHLPTAKAAGVLGVLPSETRNQAVVFMCTAKQPSPEAVVSMEKYFESKIGREKKSGKIEETDKLDVVTGILQQVDSSIERELMSAINERSQEIGNEIRDRLFTFEDIVNLNDAVMRQIVQEIDVGSLAAALRNASIDLREKFFRSMSKRAAEALKEEMEFSQKMKLSEIQDRQKDIVAIIRSLESDGQIAIGGGGEDEYI